MILHSVALGLIFSIVISILNLGRGPPVAEVRGPLAG